MSDEPTGEGTTTAPADGEVGLADLQRTIRRGFALVLIQLALVQAIAAGDHALLAVLGLVIAVSAVVYLFLSVLIASVIFVAVSLVTHRPPERSVACVHRNPSSSSTRSRCSGVTVISVPSRVSTWSRSSDSFEKTCDGAVYSNSPLSVNVSTSSPSTGSENPSVSPTTWDPDYLDAEDRTARIRNEECVPTEDRPPRVGLLIEGGRQWWFPIERAEGGDA